MIGSTSQVPDMRWKRTISMVEAHAEGEVGRVVTSGITDIPGETLLDKMLYINETDDSLRRFLVFEPRGYAQMSTNLLLPASDPKADIGYLILQGDKAHAMSGSNSICVVTVLLETGIVEMQEPLTVVKLETPAGLIIANATCKNGKCVSVELEMPASFVLEKDIVLEVEGLGTVKIDIAYGGIFYGLIDPHQFGLEIKPDNARKLVDIGNAIHRQINKSMTIVHPLNPAIKDLSYTMFTGTKDDGSLIGSTVLPPGRLDRSPCGTGNCARLALRALNGEVKAGDIYNAASIIDSTFRVEYVADTKIGSYQAVLPRISGRGWIHGLHQIGLDPDDPWPLGYKLSDCWGDAFDLLR